MFNIVHYERNAINITVKYHLSPVRTAISKNLQTINAGEDEEKRQPSCTAGKNVNWYNHYGEQYGDSLKKKPRDKITIWPSNPTTGHILWENHNSKRHMYSSVHCSTIYNSQDMDGHGHLHLQMNG